MKKLILSLGVLGSLLVVSTVGVAKQACSQVTDPKPTQLFRGKEANCTCKFPADCDVGDCQTRPNYEKKCDVSPSVFQPSPDSDLLAARLPLDPKR